MKNLFYFFFPAMDILERGITGLLLLIDGLLYRFLSVLFKLFYSLAEVQLLDSSVYEKIADRVYLFVGIIALFGLSLGLLKALVNPDELNKGVIKSFKALITSVILLILMPTIFKYAYSFQHAVIADGVIEKIFQVDLGNNNNAGSMFEMCTFDEKEVKNLEVNDFQGNLITDTISIATNECQANYMIMNVMEAFITPANDNVSFTPARTLTNWSPKGSSWANAREYMIYTGNFNYVTNFVDEVHKPKSADESVSYIFIVSTIAAGIMIYIVLSFCIDLGVRTVKLAFYQVISPIPVLMKMIPGKEGQFDKWLKATISAFLEVFSRLIIISFIMFMIGNIFEIIDSMDGLDDVNLIGKAVIVIGLFTFAKQAPKLLSEALGFEGGNLSFKIKDKLTSPPIIGKGFSAAYNGANKLKGAATGAVGAGIISAANHGNFWDGAKYGAIQGGKKGGNQFNKQRQAFYNELGFDGKVGITGGPSYLESKMKDIKNNAAKNVKNSQKQWVQEYEEKDSKFINLKQGFADSIRISKENELAELNARLAEEQKGYKQEEQRIMQVRDNEKLAYENAQAKIKQLQAELNKPGYYDGEDYVSITSQERQQIVNEIEQLNKVTYDATKYENMIAANKMAMDNDREIEPIVNAINGIEKYLANNDQIMLDAAKKARSIRKLEDSRYGTAVDAVEKIEKREKIDDEVKSTQGQANLEIMKKALEAMNNDKK